jgi:hypothetical protein
VTLPPDSDFVADIMPAKDRWFMVTVAAGMTGVCVLLIIWGGVVGLIGGLPGAVFFGVICLPFITRRALHPLPALVVSADGFTVNAHALDMGFISWDEVESIGTTSLGAFSRVVVKLRDPDAFLRRHRPVRRVLLELNGKAKLATVRIPGANLPLPVSDVAEIMEAKRRGKHG